jgi:hypothetical protein
MMDRSVVLMHVPGILFKAVHSMIVMLSI